MGYTIRTQSENIMTKDYVNGVTLAKSNHAYLNNNKIVNFFNSESWLGKRCFIIGGGESLKGFDFTKLNNELTIGINKAFYTYPNSTINYSMDSVLYDDIKSGRLDKHNEEKHWDKWMSYKGIRVFLTPLETKKFGPEVYLIKRSLERILNQNNLDEGIYGGMNSGLGAISLAVALGSTEIYLLGYDLKCKESSHFHSGYDSRNLEEFNNKLKEYRDEITLFKHLLDYYKIKVYNTDFTSELKCFPFITIDKVLGE